MLRIKKGMNINNVLSMRNDLTMETYEIIDGDVYSTYIGKAFCNDYNSELYIDVINDIVEEVGICALV